MIKNILKITQKNQPFVRYYCNYYGQKNNNTPYSTDPVENQFEIKNRVTKYNEQYNKHKTIVPFYNKNSITTPTETGLYPRDSSVFIAPSASIIGNVNLGAGSSVWYNCVIKADKNYIHIGSYTNIQDGTIINEAPRPLSLNHNGSTIIGDFTTVGHSCILEACTVEENCLIGMGSTLETGSYVEANSILGSHSILPKDARVKSGELWAGRPAKFIRKLTEVEILDIHNQAFQYTLNGNDHSESLRLKDDSYIYADAEKQGIEVGFKGEYYSN
ncbi:bacterial transferase hexapeptide repeat-containing protein [Tieghemostelium lacteum]|uniref:Bacterial transferase hexapeptide repeat-containing protein n=1 Tax=Tieghemostelium lacteum TaxID=361077 RepID=A0A152A4E3_TIELA|nr:bacterial transferase hexapeptide repeat-containing protein [Tieghemostelium lacteum]|eukprot:KYR01112.1 bacterial transferase hexapeptide repeat-containing protein [Tieghemostelium lacteum]